jgi:hypothetical protein
MGFTLIIPGLWRLRQEDCKFKACLKINNNNKKKDTDTR